LGVAPIGKLAVQIKEGINFDLRAGPCLAYLFFAYFAYLSCVSWGCKLSIGLCSGGHMFQRSLLSALVFAAFPLVVYPQINSSPDNTAACVPQAYVANLLPIFQPTAALPESAYQKFDDTGATNVSVAVLVTIGPDGAVTGTEALGGPEFLRQTSTDTVRHYKYQPVIRNGQPVCALTSTRVVFQTPGKLLAPQDSAVERAAWERLQAIQQQWQRTPQQVLADMQQEVDVPGGYRRTLALPRLARAALAAGETDKAVSYAKEGLSPGGGGGDATFYCNMVLGQVALRNGDVAEAAQYLIASGKSSGSPALNTSGPNMSLAKELLEKGQSDVVLEFFDLCKAFWTNHVQLDSWAQTVREGGVPNFGANLLY
jgi:hypothetical protein